MQIIPDTSSIKGMIYSVGIFSFFYHDIIITKIFKNDIASLTVGDQIAMSMCIQDARYSQVATAAIIVDGGEAGGQAVVRVNTAKSGGKVVE